MNSIQHIWSFLSGKKTYLIAVVAAIYAWGITHGLWASDPFVETLLAGGGLAALRHGWKTEAVKIVAAVIADPPKLPVMPVAGSGAAPVAPAVTTVSGKAVAGMAGLLLGISLMFGCASSPHKVAYEVYGTTQIGVQTAIATIWEPYVKVYHPPLDQERAVKAGYEKWQSVMAAAGDAGALWAAAVASSDTTAIAHALGVFDQAVAEAGQARSDVLDLIQKFSKQPVPGK